MTSTLERVAVPSSGRLAAPLLGTAGVLLALGLWQWSTTIGPLADISGIPAPTEVLEGMQRLLMRETFWIALGQTLVLTVVSLLIGTLIGVVVGLITGFSTFMNIALAPTIDLLKSVPPVVLLPIVLLVVGPTGQLAITLAAFAAVWPVLIHTLVGVRGADVVALDTARSLDLSWLQTQRWVVLPGALPNIATGVRIAGSTTLMLVIGTGILGGSPGLGTIIVTAQQNNDPPVVFACVIVAGLLGLGTAFLLGRLDRWVTRHHPSLEETA